MLTKAIEEFVTALNPSQLNEMYTTLEKIIVDRKEEEAQKVLKENHEKWCGRVFKKDIIGKSGYTRYYKIVSEYASSENRVSVFTFYDWPRYEYIYSYKYATQMDHYLDAGKFNLFSFGLDTVLITDILNERMKEISISEYNTAFDAHCKALKEMKFEIKR